MEVCRVIKKQYTNPVNKNEKRDKCGNIYGIYYVKRNSFEITRTFDKLEFLAKLTKYYSEI